MKSAEGTPRGRLLTESSTRAFAGLRDRATSSLARIRVVAGGAFCLLAALFKLGGQDDLRMNLWPVLAYAATSWAVFRWVGRGGWRNQFAVF
jgi:hypothetical protein